MNPLQRLIIERLEERGWSYGDVARRAVMPRSTIHNLATRDSLARPPQRETLRKLADGLDLPIEQVQAAAAEAAGFHLYEDHPDETIQVLIASVERLNEAQRQQVLGVVNSLLDKDRSEGGSST